MQIEAGNGILSKPTCSYCGFAVKNDCVIGAGCPRCGQRIFPPAVANKPVIAEGAGAAELQSKDALIASLQAELAAAKGEQ